MRLFVWYRKIVSIESYVQVEITEQLDMIKRSINRLSSLSCSSRQSVRNNWWLRLFVNRSESKSFYDFKNPIRQQQYCQMSRTLQSEFVIAQSKKWLRFTLYPHLSNHIATKTASAGTAKICLFVRNSAYRRERNHLDIVVAFFYFRRRCSIFRILLIITSSDDENRLAKILCWPLHTIRKFISLFN